MNQKEKSQPGPIALACSALAIPVVAATLPMLHEKRLCLGSGWFGNNKIGKQLRPKRAEQWWPVRRKEALEILYKGWIVRTIVGQNIPACVVLNAVRHGLVCKEAFCR